MFGNGPEKGNVPNDTEDKSESLESGYAKDFKVVDSCRNDYSQVCAKRCLCNLSST